MQRTLTATGSLAVVAALALTGCSAGGGSSSKASSAGSSAVTPAATLQAAKKNLDTTSGVHLKVTSQRVPKSATGLLSGEGDGSHAPAFKGNINVRIPVAGTVNVPVVAVDGKVWAKTPLNSSMSIIKPADFGVPDPAKLFATSGGLSSLLTATQNPKFGSKKRDGSDIVQTITGTLPGATVKTTLGVGRDTSYKVTYLVTDSNQLRSATLQGQFYADATDTAYTIGFTKYGQKVAVSAP